MYIRVFGGLEKGLCDVIKLLSDLTAEAVQGLALSFQGIYHIHGSYSLSLGMLSVCHGISDHILEEMLQNTSGFLIYQAADSLDTTSTSQSADCRLSYTLNIISKNFAMSLCTAFSKSFTSLASA